MKEERNLSISIVTVVFNSVHLIEKTILSVLNQDCQNIDYIIIDGGSTDGTLDIINKYKDSVNYFISEKDNGIYDAMNKAVDKASGNWICFLNAGDVFVDTQILSRVSKGIITHPESEIYYGNIFIKTSSGELKERIAGEPTNKHRMFFCHQSAFVQTKLLKQFPFDIRHKMSADLKFFKQCFYDRRKFSHLSFPIVIFDTSGISNANREAGIRDNIAVIKEIDKGLTKCKFLIRLYFVIYWRKLTGKS